MTTYKVLSAFAIAITSMTLLTNTVLANKRIENHGFTIKVIEEIVKLSWKSRSMRSKLKPI